MAEVAVALDRERFEPLVGVFRGEGLRADELRAAGVPVTEFPLRSFKSPGAARVTWELARYIRRNHIALVHTFDLPLTAYAIPVTRWLTPAAALASQRSHLGLASPMLRRLLVAAERTAAGVVVNCEFLRRHLIEDAGIRPGRIHVCPNAIDLARFHRAPRIRQPSLPQDALVIGAVCVLRPEKDLGTLIEAFARVRPLAPGCRLVIVGGGPARAGLEERARALGVADACHFEPPTADVERWLGNIDIFVLPSLSEAFSNSLMEAMACGCCVVASRVGGNPELVEDGTRGLLFAPGDVASLAAALAALIRAPALRARLAAAGHDFLHAGFSSAASARRMAEIYATVLREQAGAAATCRWQGES